MSEAEIAYREALTLVNSLWNEHYRERAPDWKPLPDLRGVISQIDNMVAGISEEIHRLKPPPLKCLRCVAPAVANLDGDNLCQVHADEWVRGEGQAARDRDATLAETPSAAPAEGSQPGPKASPND